MRWDCPVCDTTIVAPKDENFRILVLEHKVHHLQQALGQHEGRLGDFEKELHRVPGSIPGDYTWDELVGNG